MSGTSMFHASNRVWNRVLFVALSLLVVLILALSWIWVQRNTRTLLATDQQFLQVYTNSLQSTIFYPIEKVAANVHQLLRLSDGTDTYADISQELYSLRYTATALDRVWIVTSSGEAVYPPNVSEELTERNPWWKKYLAEDKISVLDQLGRRGFGPYEYEVAPAFRDDLNLSTILPVVVWYQTQGGAIAFAFLEFNLTSLLEQQVNSYRVSLGDGKTDLEVIIFDKNGLALETSRNLPVKVEDMPAYLEDSALVHSIDLSNGDVFTRQDSYLSLISRNTALGLTFSIRLPWQAVIGPSRKNYIFILLLAGLFAIVFLILMVVYVRLHANIRRYEAMQAQSRFEALQARMNPHFLFNTLDSLVSVVEEGDRKRSLDSLRSLSYMLHFDLREQRHEIPLLSEIRYIRNYVNLQEIRYQGLFTFAFDIDDSVPDDLHILKYCIQPLVENCFVHGVYLRGRPISIHVDMCCDRHGLCVRVTDDGPGCEASVLETLERQLATPPHAFSRQELHLRGKHIGLQNINQRIFYAYGQGYGLRLLTPERGFCVEVSLPYVYHHVGNLQIADLEQNP